MAKSTITLNEAQFRALVEECVNEVLLDEAFEGLKNTWNNVKAAGKAIGRTWNDVRGAIDASKQYMNTQKLAYQGIDNKNWLGKNGEEFLQHHDFTKEGPGNWRNTASEQANEIQRQMTYHLSQAKKLEKVLKQFDKKYNFQTNWDAMDQHAKETGEKSKRTPHTKKVRYAPDVQLNAKGQPIIHSNPNGPKVDPRDRGAKFAKQSANDLANKYGANKNRNTFQN